MCFSLCLVDKARIWSYTSLDIDKAYKGTMSDTRTEQDQDELTGGDAAALLGVSRQRVNQLAHDGTIPARHVAGRFWIFRRADVEAYKARRNVKGGRPKKTATSTQPK